ncbi:unnamed protein product [Rotaria sordida]|uniref:Uncharacterized protein n=1 Tax=Rotaria sordida TaxID=392033 RepID=A0A813TDJ6_9BILA|nr:unnamed protein product [Rotaria sordida]CAF0792012.1 unnamed protein product [Rotaria sordida]CAF0811114.1 unnamed protein product [Rotaria sordida]CAF0820532.1 unnamed protein product [Rotaria sordida]CAF0821821.1 unnamed protein product [Rotaria sordida]
MSSKYSNDVEYDYLFKILIIGDSGVGKTAILQRFTHNYFSNEYLATIGVDFQLRTINVDTKRCKLQVWDTAGQDRFKCVVSTFYRGAHGVIICFDITDIQSFHHVDNWLEEIKKYCINQTPVYLVGTKSDLQSKRVVSYSTIKTYSDSKNLSYIETSSKTNENIENCFIDFARTLVTHNDYMEINQKTKQIEQPKIDIRDKTNPVTSGRCSGENKCTI